MRLPYFCVLYLAAVLPGYAQTAASAGQGLPKDPREILAAAAPFYDFTSPELKPWHLKATYQLYDEKSKPSEQGTYEYWWASPQVYRSTWTRPGATHTEWHIANGKHAHQDSGEALKFFEYKLQAALFSPIPTHADLSPDRSRMELRTVGSKGDKFPCIMVIPLMPKYPGLKDVPLGLFPTFCFDPQMPVLSVSHDFGTLTMGFNHIVKFQNRYLAREILFLDGTRKILTASVDTITGLAPSDPALTPPIESQVAKSADAPVTKLDKVPISAGVMVGMLVKKTTPYYPQDAKDAHVSGRVVLQAVIGTDGGIHNLHVLSSPSPLLAVSALWAVSQWQYKPYLLMGEPVEVDTTVNVIFSLGN